MSEFQFAKSQRVTVPADRAGAEGIQGVVTVNVARLGREPHYEVQWPSCDSVGDTGDLKMLCTDVSETELLKAQPPKMFTAEEMDLHASRAVLANDRQWLSRTRKAVSAARRAAKSRKRR